jgi:hypothetical protein
MSNCREIAQLIGLTKPSEEWSADDYRLFQKAEEIELARSSVVSIMQTMADRLQFAAKDLKSEPFWRERYLGGVTLDLDKLVRSSLFDLERKTQELKTAIEAFYRLESPLPMPSPQVLERPADKLGHGGDHEQKSE